MVLIIVKTLLNLLGHPMSSLLVWTRVCPLQVGGKKCRRIRSFAVLLVTALSISATTQLDYLRSFDVFGRSLVKHPQTLLQKLDIKDYLGSPSH